MDTSIPDDMFAARLWSACVATRSIYNSCPLPLYLTIRGSERRWDFLRKHYVSGRELENEAQDPSAESGVLRGDRSDIPIPPRAPLKILIESRSAAKDP